MQKKKNTFENKNCGPFVHCGPSKIQIQPRSSSRRNSLKQDVRKSLTTSVTRSTTKPAKKKGSYLAASINTEVDRQFTPRLSTSWTKNPNSKCHAYTCFKSHHDAKRCGHGRRAQEELQVLPNSPWLRYLFRHDSKGVHQDRRPHQGQSRNSSQDSLTFQLSKTRSTFHAKVISSQVWENIATTPNTELIEKSVHPNRRTVGSSCERRGSAAPQPSARCSPNVRTL